MCECVSDGGGGGWEGGGREGGTDGGGREGMSFGYVLIAVVLHDVVKSQLGVIT